MKKVLILFLFCFLFQQVNSAENEIYKKIDLFGEVLEKINKEYVDEINQSESMDSAINGLLQSLDPYSAYMSPEIFNVVREIIQIQSVKADILEKNIGYLRLTSFNENSGKQIERELSLIHI